MGWLKTLGTIGGGLAFGPVGAIAGGMIGGGADKLFGKGKKNDGIKMPDQGMIDQMSITDSAVAGITDNVTRNANTTLAQTMNSNRDIVARGNLSPQAEAALNRGSAIGTQQAIGNSTADLQLKQQLSRTDAIRFLLGLQQQKDQMKQQRDSSLLSGIGQIASAAPQILGYYKNGGAN